MDYREEFLQIWHQYVSRPGSEKLLDWLDNKTDFFSAPAATGSFGANHPTANEYTMKYRGRLSGAEEFGELVIKSLPFDKTFGRYSTFCYILFHTLAGNVVHLA